MTPKAEFFDAVTDSATAVDIGTVAKVLNAKLTRERSETVCSVLVMACRCRKELICCKSDKNSGMSRTAIIGAGNLMKSKLRR